MTPARDDTLLGLLLLAAAVLSGLYLLWPEFAQPHPLALDEHGSMWMVQAESVTACVRRSLDWAAVPPLSSLLERLSLAAFGMHEWALRLPSALGYLAAVVAIFFWGRSLRDEALGGAAALLLAWHPGVVDEVRIARAYGLTLLLSVLVGWVSWEWSRRPDSRRPAVLWAIACAALCWTHYTGMLLPAMTVPAMMLSSRGSGVPVSRRWLSWGLGGLLFAVLCAPLLPSIWRLREWGPFLNFMPDTAKWWEIIGPMWWLGLPVGAALARLGRERPMFPPNWKTPTLFLAVCSLAPLALIAAFAHGDAASLANPRYRVALAPPAAALLAVWLARGDRPTRTVVALIVAIVLSWSTSAQPPWRLVRLADPASHDWKSLALDLRDRSRPDEPIFVQSGLVESLLIPAYLEEEDLLSYAACRVSRFYLPADNPRVGLPYFWDIPPTLRSAYRSRLDSLAANGPGAFWIAAATDTDLNRRSLDEMRQVGLDAGYVVVDTRELPTAMLVRMERPPATPR